MNTPLPALRAQGFKSTVRRFGTYCALMTSSPSPRTKRRYGESFSVLNLSASSCATAASLAMDALHACILIYQRRDACGNAMRRRILDGRSGDGALEASTQWSGGVILR